MSSAPTTPTATAAGRYGDDPGTKSPASGIFTVWSSISVTPCSTSIPSPSMARKRCMSVTVAGFSARPNGRDLRTSPGENGRGEQHVRRQAACPREEPERRVVRHDVLVMTCAGRLTTCTGPAAEVCCGAAAAAARGGARGGDLGLAQLELDAVVRPARRHDLADDLRVAPKLGLALAERLRAAGRPPAVAHGCAATTAQPRKKTTRASASP